MIEKQADFINGPEVRDPRLNVDYVQYIKNKIDGEKFWVKYVCDNPLVQEVRWDLYEDAMLQFLQDSLVFNKEEITKINWQVFFSIIFEKIAVNENEVESLNPAYPLPTSFQYNPESFMRYMGKKVRKPDWIGFIQNIGFSEYAKRCIVY